MTVVLDSPAAIDKFKDALASNPALAVDVKSEQQNLEETFKSLRGLFDFISYFIGAMIAIGAVFCALNSLYASVEARKRELATLRAIGFSGGPIVISVLAEGLLLAVPAALVGAWLAWALFNGNTVSTFGLTLHLGVTAHIVIVSVIWAVTIGLIGASLPALRAARLPVATALRAT
jgi:putative ABC transport system permease protein